MNVRELSKRLSEMDPDAEVRLWNQYDYMYGCWSVVEQVDTVRGKVHIGCADDDLERYDDD